MATKSASKPVFLREIYKNEIVSRLQQDLKIKNVNAVPKVEKVIINVGIGKLLEGSKDYSEIVDNITRIAGQKPVVAQARKSISNFKIREGMPVGIHVTLRGESMYNFIYKLVNIVLPRTRDFRGISPKSFDGKGNYSLAIKEHTVFPEINQDDIVRAHGLQITVVTNAKNNQESYQLLKELGFPFQGAPTK